MRSYFIPSICFLLASVSLVTLKSVMNELLIKQLFYFGLGFLIFFIVANIPLKKILIFSPPLYFGLCLFLLILLIIGQTTRGITAWVDLIAGFKLQPSQFAIPIVSLYLIKSIKKRSLNNLPEFIKILVIILFPAILILLQPDMGTGFIYLVSVTSILVILRIPFKYLFTLFIFGIMSLVFIWFFVLADFQKSRLTSFIQGYQEENSASYNAHQSLIAVGSGRFFGRGVGFGVQSHLRFLPERQTDFIFASFAEEWGFLGTFFLVSLYFSLIVFLFIMIFKIDEYRYQLIILIVINMLTWQTGINIAMNLALVPITGITLPLMSFGGSSIMAIFIILAIVQNIILHHRNLLSYEIK